MNSAYRLLALFAFASLGGCGSSADVKETLGLNRQAPDEFRVVARPPLSLPPEFNLRPPGSDSEYVSGMPADARARAQVLTSGGASSAPFTNPSAAAVTPVGSGELPDSADAQLLSNAGAAHNDPAIRQKILDDKLNGVGPKDSTYLFGGKSEADPQVDADKEAARLKDDKAQNKPPTAGDTPVIVPENKGILSGIF